jgi:hypothetical protein
MDVRSVGMVERFPKEVGLKPNVRAMPSEIIKDLLLLEWVKIA